MLILLPPSEGKTPAVRGSAVDWRSLSFPELNACRAKVLESLGTFKMDTLNIAVLGKNQPIAQKILDRVGYK